MPIVKADYKQDILTAEMDGKRKYKLNPVLGTDQYEIEDVTEYKVEGDTFGSSDINSTNLAIMGFATSTVVFGDDGSITETDLLGNTIKTTFANNGNINQELKDSSQNVISTVRTTFNSDGSITTQIV